MTCSRYATVSSRVSCPPTWVGEGPTGHSSTQDKAMPGSRICAPGVSAADADRDHLATTLGQSLAEVPPQPHLWAGVAPTQWAGGAQSQRGPGVGPARWLSRQLHLFSALSLFRSTLRRAGGC